MADRQQDEHSTARLVWVEATAIAQTVVGEMEQPSVPCVLVHEERRWVGVVGERQVLRAIAQGHDLRQIEVRQMMQPAEQTLRVAPGQDWETLRHLFQAEGVAYVPVVAADGEVVAILTVQDILRAEGQPPSKNLALSPLDDLSLFQQAVDNSPNAIFLVDAEGYILAWNAACRALLGYDDPAIEQQTLWNLLATELDQRAIATALPQVFAGQTLSDQDIRYHAQDGRLCHAVSRLYPLHNQAGQIVACVIANTDITSRCQAAEQLRQREQTLLRAQELAQIGNWTLNLATHEITLSAIAAAMIGLPNATTLPCEHLLGYLHLGDRPRLQTVIFQAISEKSPFSLEVRFPQADAACRYTFIHGQVELDDQNQVQSVFGTVQDITLQREAENFHRLQARRNQLLLHITQRIRQSLDLQEILFTTAAEMRQILDIDRVVLYRFEANWEGVFVVEAVSHPDYSVLGQTVDDPCFREHHIEKYRNGRISVVHDVAAANVMPCYRATLQDFNIQANLVVPILAGERLWGLLIAHHCSAPRHWQTWEQELLQQIGIQAGIAIQQAELYEWVQQLNLDLEEKVRQRTARLERVNSFESLLKRITDRVRDSLDEQQILQKVVKELTLELQISSCDTGIYDLEHQTSMIQQEFVVDDAISARGQVVDMRHFPQVYAQLLQGESLHFCWCAQGFERESSIRDVHKPHAVLTCPLIDNQGVIGDLWLYRMGHEGFDEFEIRLVQQIANQCAIAIRQARLYEASQLQVKELAHLNRLKDEFLSSVSHELRTPMANVKMATEMLEVKLSEMGILFNAAQPMVNRYFQILKVECQRELKLINDLLDLSRLDANTEPLILSTMDLADWLHHLAEPFEARTRNAHQTLVLDIPGHMPPLTADFAYLARILGELLNNACKYTPFHEVITLRVDWRGDHLQIAVINTGIEIPPAEQQRVFERFYRIPSADPWKHEGTGLGLALVEKLAEQLGGTVSLTSECNQTSFTLHLFPSLMAERFAAVSRQLAARNQPQTLSDF